MFCIAIPATIFVAGFLYFSFGEKSSKITIENPNKFENNNMENVESFEKSINKPAESIASMQSDENVQEQFVSTEKEDTARDKSEAKKLEVIEREVSWGFKKNEKTKKPEQRNVLDIDTVVIHSSYDDKYDKENPYNFNGIIQEYKDYDVSPHYLIDRDGIIYQLLPDKYFAYHAGESKMPDGRTGANAFSLGIELMNTMEDKYTTKQYDSLNELLTHLKEKYNIKFIVGHGQIAPERRSDPWNFDWSKVDN